MSSFEFNITEHIGVLNSDTDGKVTKELNVVEWNGRKAAYDLRAWKADGENGEVKTPLKGIVLTKEELMQLRELLISLKLEEQGKEAD